MSWQTQNKKTFEDLWCSGDHRKAADTYKTVVVVAAAAADYLARGQDITHAPTVTMFNIVHVTFSKSLGFFD